MKSHKKDQNQQCVLSLLSKELAPVYFESNRPVVNQRKTYTHTPQSVGHAGNKKTTFLFFSVSSMHVPHCIC